MKFREIAPIPELKPIVECIWTLEGKPDHAAGQIEPVLPDGCPELVMQFGDPFERIRTDGNTLVGISPKRLARIIRFQRALRMLQRFAGGGAATALACGYADQPHFIRDFTELAGCPPAAHLLRHAELSGFFTSSPYR
jgi:hypothetical protein